MNKSLDFVKPAKINQEEIHSLNKIITSEKIEKLKITFKQYCK